MFDNKKDADAHDKMLELAENFSLLLRNQIEGITEQQAENVGLLLSKNKSAIVAACKGNPGLLLEIGCDDKKESSNVTNLTAKA